MCRRLRIEAGYTMYDQAVNTGFELIDIANYETSDNSVPLEYVGKLAFWLKLDLVNHQKLIKAAKKPKLTATIPELGRRDSVNRFQNLMEISNFTPLRLSTFGRYLQLRG